MNKFDELMVLNAQLDAVLGDMNKANKHLEDELKAKRNAAQEQMFNDIAVLRGYMKKVGMDHSILTTGLLCGTTTQHETIALCVHTRTEDVGLYTLKDDCLPGRSRFYRWYKKDKFFEDVNDGSNTIMLAVRKHWDVAYANMQNDLFDKMQEFMASSYNLLMKL